MDGGDHAEAKEEINPNLLHDPGISQGPLGHWTLLRGETRAADEARIRDNEARSHRDQAYAKILSLSMQELAQDEARLAPRARQLAQERKAAAKSRAGTRFVSRRNPSFKETP